MKSPQTLSPECTTMNVEIYSHILTLLANGRAALNWYEIDRKLAQKGLGGQCNIAEAATSLSEEGLLNITPGEKSGMPLYVIAEAGVRWLDDHGDCNYKTINPN